MRTISRGFFTILLTSAACALNPLRAQVIVSNMDTPTGAGGNVGNDNWFAQGFSTPASTAYTLTSVDLMLAYENAPDGTFSVSLWGSGGNGLPASQISPISSGNNVSTLTTSFADTSFAAPSGITLAANTTYFLVLSASSGVADSGLVWGDTATLNPGSTGPGQIGGWSRSNNGGAAWDPVESGFPFQIAVMGTAVPEPGAYAMMAGLALACFAAMRRYRIRST